MTSNELVLADLSPCDLFKIKIGLELLNNLCQDRMSSGSPSNKFNNRFLVPFLKNIEMLVHDDVIYLMQCKSGSYDNIIVRIDAACDYYNDSSWRVKYEPFRNMFTLRHKSNSGVVISKFGKNTCITDVPVLVSNTEDCSSELFQMQLIHDTSVLNTLILHDLFKNVLYDKQTHIQIGEDFLLQLITIYDNYDELKELLNAKY